MRARPEYTCELDLFEPVFVGKRKTLSYVVAVSMYGDGFQVREGKVGEDGKLRGPYRYRDEGKTWRRARLVNLMGMG